jgi:hypothetical protein
MRFSLPAVPSTLLGVILDFEPSLVATVFGVLVFLVRPSVPIATFFTFFFDDFLKASSTSLPSGSRSSSSEDG